MRFESPLDPDEFRRESLEPDDVSSPASNEGRRITIRPLAGSAVGTTMVHRVSASRVIVVLKVSYYVLRFPLSSVSFLRLWRNARVPTPNLASRGRRNERFAAGTMRNSPTWRRRLPRLRLGVALQLLP